MVSRNKGIFSQGFLVQNGGLLLSILFIGILYSTVIRPRAAEIEITGRLLAAQGADKGGQPQRSLVVILKDFEQQIEFTLCLWGVFILSYKLFQVGRERTLLKETLIRLDPGERIIPNDALDRHKDLKSAIDQSPTWNERILPEVVLSALQQFHATQSIPGAASAVKERLDLAADEMDSSLSLIRYIAWAIPAVGFIGTVRGIGEALAQTDQAVKGDLSGVTTALGLAFNSTLVALVLSILLMFMIHMLQSRQESLIHEVHAYCRDRVLGVMKTVVSDFEERDRLTSA